MTIFTLISILVVLAAICSFLNYRFLRMPPTIGVMAMALAASLILIAAGSTARPLRTWAISIVSQIDFNQAVLHGMLAFLLFAGGLFLDITEIAREKWTIGLLSIVSTALSTLLIGAAASVIFSLVRIPIPFLTCLLFGALISPTDPIAVLAIMRKVGAPRRLEIQLAGESLFNDGIGVVLFLTLLAVATNASAPTVNGILLLLARQIAGAVGVGLLAGMLAHLLLKRVDQYQVEILLTLALAMGGYALADSLHLSAPITAVVAGLFVGNRTRDFAMSAKTREHLDLFWELIDEFLNAILFLLIGLEVLTLPFSPRNLLAGLCLVPALLLVRAISVGAIILPLRRPLSCYRGTIRILTWGGLRGGLSVAMALSLPRSAPRDPLLEATYVIVAFSIIVQGLSAGPFIRSVLRPR